MAWLVIFVGVIVYELMADDLLSESCARHRWLTRLLIAPIAGHLAGVVPVGIDMFDARNVFHQWAVARYPLARDRVKRQ